MLTAVEFVVVHGGVGLYIGIGATDGIDEALGALPENLLLWRMWYSVPVIVDRLAVEILEAEGDAV